MYCQISEIQSGTLEEKIMNMKQSATLKKKHEEIIEKENCCSICGSKLEFSHFIDYSMYHVKESATCKECGVRYQIRGFSLN